MIDYGSGEATPVVGVTRVMAWTL